MKPHSSFRISLSEAQRYQSLFDKALTWTSSKGFRTKPRARDLLAMIQIYLRDGHDS